MRFPVVFLIWWFLSWCFVQTKLVVSIGIYNYVIVLTLYWLIINKWKACTGPIYRRLAMNARKIQFSKSTFWQNYEKRFACFCILWSVYGGSLSAQIPSDKDTFSGSKPLTLSGTGIIPLEVRNMCRNALLKLVDTKVWLVFSYFCFKVVRI